MAEPARWLTVLEEARGLLRLADSTVSRVARQPSAVVGLDDLIGGGVPVGRIVEIYGAPSSGGTALVLALAASVTTRGGTVAWIDAFDALDPASMAAAGCDLDRVLWVRAPASMDQPLRSWVDPASSESVDPSAAPRAIRRASLRALDLVLSTDGFSLVVLDSIPSPGQKRFFVPDTTWVRVARTCEAHRTTLVVLGERPTTGAQSILSLSMGRARDSGGNEGSLRVKVARSRGPIVRGESELRALPTPIEPWMLRQGRGRMPRTRRKP